MTQRSCVAIAALSGPRRLRVAAHTTRILVLKPPLGLQFNHSAYSILLTPSKLANICPSTVAITLVSPGSTSRLRRQKSDNGSGNDGLANYTATRYRLPMSVRWVAGTGTKMAHRVNAFARPMYAHLVRYQRNRAEKMGRRQSCREMSRMVSISLHIDLLKIEWIAPCIWRCPRTVFISPEKPV